MGDFWVREGGETRARPSRIAGHGKIRESSGRTRKISRVALWSLPSDAGKREKRTRAREPVSKVNLHACARVLIGESYAPRSGEL